MRASALGLIVGLISGLALVFGDFGDFLVVLLLGAIGYTVGRFLDGDLDIARLLDRHRTRR
jgi:uncharacterized membrane protein